MKTLTDKALVKLAQAYIDSLSHVVYALDGEDKEIDFYSKKVVGKMACAYVLLDENYKGTISKIRVIDKEGDIVAEDNRVYTRTTDKALYIAFKHDFSEV